MSDKIIKINNILETILEFCKLGGLIIVVIFVLFVLPAKKEEVNKTENIKIEQAVTNEAASEFVTADEGVSEFAE